MDVIHSESDLLVEGRWSHPVEDDLANPMSARISAAMAILVLITVSVLSWILYYKAYSKVIFWHALFSSVGVLLAFVVLVWAFKTGSSIAVNRWPNTNLTFIVFFCSTISILYYLVAAIFIWVNSSFHLNYMQAAKDRPEVWRSFFWDYEYENARTEDFRIHIAMSILCLVAAVIFGVISFNVYAFITNTVELKKILLGNSLIAVIVFGFFITFIHEDYYFIFALIQKRMNHANVSWETFAFVLGVICIGLAIVDSILTFLRVKTINMLLGVFWLLTFLALTVVVAFLFINVVRFSKDKPYNPEDVAYLAHEDEYSKFCVSKYLPNAKIGESILTYRWESRPLKTALLNQNCKPVVNDVLIWNYYLTAIFSGFLAAGCLVAGITNVSLAMSQNRYDTYNRFHIVELFTLIIIGVLVAWLGIHLLTRDRPEPINRYTETDSFYIIDSTGNLVPNPEFKHLIANTAVKLLSKLVS